MKITRSYAVDGDIEGDCPGNMCHSAGLSQSNPPTRKKRTIRMLGTNLR